MGTIGLQEILLIIIFLVIYFLPSIIAKKNKKSNFRSIFLLNIFLGWTLIGWVVSLIWSLTNDNNSQTIIVNNYVPEDVMNSKKADNLQTESSQNKIDQLKQLKELLDTGVLTQEEFDREKSRII